MKNYLALFALIFSFALNTQASNEQVVTHLIVSKVSSPSDVIEVDQNLNTGRLSFRLCYDFDSPQRNCISLGRTEGYSKAELSKIRKVLRAKSIGKGALDAVIVAAAIYSGAWIGGTVAGSAATGGFLELGMNILAGMGVGSVTTGAIAGYIVSTIDFLNPRSQWRQANAISPKTVNMLQEGDMIVSVPISEFALELKLALGQ